MRNLSLADYKTHRVVAGCMRLYTVDDAAIRDFYQQTRDAGVNFFDHADIYWEHEHQCETRFRDALKLSAAERDDIILQSKCGIHAEAQAWYDFSYDRIIKQVEDTLVALGTDYLDILLLHRPDPLVEPAEVARAFDELQAAGKVMYFGVSNHTVRQMELLRTQVKQQLSFNQMQLSLTHCPLIAAGVSTNMAGVDQSVLHDDGILDYARLQDITIQAWSPIQAGFFTGTFLDNPEYPELNAVLERLGAEYGVTKDAIAYAWICRHPARMQVVTGTTKGARVAAAKAGSEIELTRHQWWELFHAAGHYVP